MQLMLECKTAVTDRLMPLRYNEPITYTRIGREALGFVGKWAVDLSVLGCNLGVCAGYMIFIASNMQVSGTFSHVRLSVLSEFAEPRSKQTVCGRLCE